MYQWTRLGTTQDYRRALRQMLGNAGQEPLRILDGQMVYAIEYPSTWVIGQ